MIRLRLPPLRERREDIPVLTRHFLQQSAQQLGVEAKRISDAAIALLQDFAFPGNVRQLENICHWLTVMAPAQAIEPKDLPPEVDVIIGSTGEPAAHMPVFASVQDEHSHLHDPELGSTSLAISNDGAGLPYPQPVNGCCEQGLEADAIALLASGRPDVWDELTRRFESRLILAALAATRGRRIEAAQKLGIGRNTITRKIQELGLE